MQATKRTFLKGSVALLAVAALPRVLWAAVWPEKTFSETTMEGMGFGLGFSVVMDPAQSGAVSSPGEFAWGGAASTSFLIDPVERITVVCMTQFMPSNTYPIRRQLKATVYQALL